MMESLPESGRFTGTATTFAMPRFDHEQVADYLHMCLFRAGLVGDSPFDHTVVSKVTERARGLVGAIDPIARELLRNSIDGGRTEADDDSSRRDSRRWPLAIVAAAGFGALLTVAVPQVSTINDGVQSPPRAGAFQSSITPAPRERAGKRLLPSAAADPGVP